MLPVKKSKETEKEVVIMSKKSFVAIHNLSKDNKSIEIEVFNTDWKIFPGVHNRELVSLEEYTSVEEFIRKLLQRIKPSTVYYTNSVEDVIEKLHGEQKFSPLKISSLTPDARKAFGVIDAAATTMRTSKTCLPAIKSSINKLEEFKAAIPKIAGRLYSNGDFKPLGTFVLPENTGEDLQTILFVSPFNLLNGEIVRGNLTLPSNGFDLMFRHYGQEKVHPAKQDVNVVNVNVSSAEPPVVLYVGTYCLNNSYSAACLVPEDMRSQLKTNCQICLTNFSTRKTGKAGSLSRKITHLRTTIKSYLLNGLVEDSELDPPSDLKYYPDGSKGLLDCSDGRSFILGVALISKKAFEQASQANANQTRIYPYAVSMWVTSNKNNCLLDDSQTEMLAIDANWLITGQFSTNSVEPVRPVRPVKPVAVKTVEIVNTVKSVAVETNPPLEVEIVDYKSIFKSYLSDLPRGLSINKIDPPKITIDDEKSSTVILVEYTLNMIEQMSSKDCQFHDWSKEDVEKVVDRYIKVCGSLSVVNTITIDKTESQSTINLWGLPFTVTKETARDHKGNQFERTLETRVNKEGKIVSIKVGSSLGNFIKFFKAVLFMKLHESNTKDGRKGFAANIERLLSKAPEIFVVTSSSLKDCNSNFDYNIAHSYKQVKYFDFDVYRQVAKVQGTNLADDVIKVLVNRNDGKVLGSQIISDSVELIMNQFKTLCHVFHKPGIYLHGLVHANIEHIEKNHPELHQLIKEQLPDITSDKVVVFTLKTSKGAKRVTLALAKAAELLDGSEMGYALVGKDYNLSRDIGKKYRSLVLPSHIAAPGLAYFLADAEDRPQAKISRNLVFPYQYYDKENPVIVEGYTASEDCFIINKEYEPNAHLFFVNGSVVQNPERENIFLNSISYAIKQDIAGKQILEVSLDYYVIHRQAKFRGIVKENFIRVDKSLVDHSLNNSQIKDFGFQMVHFQDTIKSDVLYYWLMLIGNTIEFNKDKSSPALAKLISEKERINESLGFDKDGVLAILQVAVLCGVYDNILSIFEKEFSQPVWIHNNELSASYGNSLATLYENYSKDEDRDWQSVECPDQYRNFIPNHKVKVYSTDSDLSKPDTNILVFFFDKKGNVTSFLQRSMGFVGNGDCPVYTCELFEVSTVRESVGTSSAVPANIRDLKGRIPAKLLSSLIKKGRKSLNKSAMLIAMNSGHDFPQIEKSIRFVRNGDSYNISKADKEYLLGLLGSDLNLNTCEESYFFEYISKKLHSVKFNCEGKYYWLPFLASVNQLRTNISVSNHICGVFREMLVAVLDGKLVPATTLRSLNAAVNSLSTTKNNLKLMPSVDTVSGKVVGAPNIPIDELWVLRSKDPGSAYQMFIKMGFRGNDAVAAFRSPIHSGAILKIKFIDSEQNESNFYKIDVDTIAINPITMYVNYGDFDGDNIYVAKLSSEHRGIQFNDYKYVMNHLKDTTGLDALDAKQTQYIADHYAIKPWSSSTKTLSQIKASLKKATVSDTQFVEQSKDACAIQTISVGLSYSQYMWVEHFAEITDCLSKDGLSLNFPGVTKEVVQRYTQAYENPLGGYSPEAKQAYLSLAAMRKRDKYTLLTKESSEFINYFQALKMMSVNVNNEDVVYQVFDLVNRLFFFAAKSNLHIENTERIIAALVVVAFELSRGKFQGFVKRSAPVGNNSSEDFGDFNDDFDFELEDDLVPYEDDLVPQIEGKKNYHQVALGIVLDNLKSATMDFLRESSLVIQHLLIVVENFKWLFDSTETLYIENEVLRTYSEEFDPVTTEVPAVVPVSIEVPAVVPVSIEVPAVVPVSTEVPAVVPVSTEVPAVVPVSIEVPAKVHTEVSTEVPAVVPAVVHTEVPAVVPAVVPASNVNNVPEVNKVSKVNAKAAESPKPRPIELMTSKQFMKEFLINWSRLSSGDKFLNALVEKFSDWVDDNLTNPNCREVCEKFDKYLKNPDSAVDVALGLFIDLITGSGADGGSTPTDEGPNSESTLDDPSKDNDDDGGSTLPKNGSTPPKNPNSGSTPTSGQNNDAGSGSTLNNPFEDEDDEGGFTLNNPFEDEDDEGGSTLPKNGSTPPKNPNSGSTPTSGRNNDAGSGSTLNNPFEDEDDEGGSTVYNPFEDEDDEGSSILYNPFEDDDKEPLKSAIPPKDEDPSKEVNLDCIYDNLDKKGSVYSKQKDFCIFVDECSLLSRLQIDYPCTFEVKVNDRVIIMTHVVLFFYLLTENTDIKNQCSKDLKNLCLEHPSSNREDFNLILSSSNIDISSFNSYRSEIICRLLIILIKLKSDQELREEFFKIQNDRIFVESIDDCFFRTVQEGEGEDLYWGVNIEGQLLENILKNPNLLNINTNDIKVVEFVDYDNYESPTLPPSEELVELGKFIESTLQCRLNTLDSSILDDSLSNLPKESQDVVENILEDVLSSVANVDFDSLKFYFIKVFEAQVAEGVFQETLLRLLNDAEDIGLDDLYSIIKGINKDDFGADNEWSYLEAITQKIILREALKEDYNSGDIPNGRLNETNRIMFEVPNNIIVKDLPAALVKRFVEQNVRRTSSNHPELEHLVNLVRHKESTLSTPPSASNEQPKSIIVGAKLSIEKLFYTRGECIAFTSNPKHKESEKYCMLSPTSLLVQPEVNKLLYSSVYNLYIAALFSGQDSVQREIMSAPTIEKVMSIDEKYKRTKFSSEEKLCILLWSMMYGLSKPSLEHLKKVLLETKGKTLVLISSQSDNDRVKNLGAISTKEGFEGVNIVGKLLEIIRDFYINSEVTPAPIYYPQICSSKVGEPIPNFSLPIAGDGTGGITLPSSPDGPKGEGENKIKIEEKNPSRNPMTSSISTNSSSKITTRNSNVVDYQENIDKFEEYLKNQKLYSQIEKQTNYAKLTLEQKAFVAMFILNGLGSDIRKQDISLGNYFLTGEAGSGKTYTVQTLITVLEILNFKVITTATTGIAATNYKGASTIFKALKIKTGLVGDKDTRAYHIDELKQIINSCSVNNSVLRRFNEEASKGVVLIIDEVSMLTSHNSVLIGELIKAIQKTSLRRRPIQLLLIGDLRQLPPVQNSNSPVTHSFVHSPYFAETLRTPEQKQEHLEFIRKEIDKCTDNKVKAELAKERKHLKDCIENDTMFFNSRKVMPTLFNMFSIKTMELKTNMRQGGDSAFAEELNKLSNGRFQDIQKWLDECPIIASRFKQKLPKDAVHLFWGNSKKDEENKKRLDSLLNQGKEPFTFIARGDVRNGYRSNYSKKDILEANGVQESITLCEGAVIRIRRNEGPEDKLILANGMRGVVTRILKDRFITTEHNEFITKVPSGLDITNIITIPGFDATILQEDNHYSIDIPGEGHKVAPNTALFKTTVGDQVDCFYNPSNEEAVFLKEIRWHLDAEDNCIEITAFFDRLDTTQVGIEFREFRTNQLKEVRPCLLFCPEEEGISVAEIYQLPVDLCWASTIHSAQGLTIKEETIVHLNCMSDFEKVPVNLLYVACSRLTDSNLLFFEEISFENSKPWGLRALKNFYKHDKISSEWMSRGYGFSLIINSKEVKNKVDNPNGSVTVSLV